MLNGVDVGYINWDLVVGDSHKDVLWILKHYYDEVEDFLNDVYEDGMSFEDFCSWARYEADSFIGEFPSAWGGLYSQGLISADDLIGIDRFQGDEESLIEYATKASPKLGEEVRQALIEEGRLDESVRRRGLRRISESRLPRTRRPRIRR